MGFFVFTVLEDFPMDRKSTYEELEQRIKDLEKAASKRQDVKEALKQKNTELNSFINNIPDMAWVKDADSRFIAVNRAFGKAVGMEPESLINQTCEVCFGEEGAKKFRDDDLRVMEGGKQEIIEEKIIDSEKKEVWLETIKSPILNESGELTGTVGIARNISKRKLAEDALEKLNLELEERVVQRTAELSRANALLRRKIDEHKQAEEALRESEEKFRQMVENINDVIYSTDDKGIFTYISPAIKTAMGYDPSEIIGRNFVELVHKDDLQYLMERFHKALSGELEPSEFRLPAKSGEYHWIRSSSRPLYEGERVIGLRGVYTDITKSKHLEKQLKQSQKMEAIGTLAGGIAHEFNNILGIILGNTELAIDDVPEWNPAKDCLEEIRSACLRAKDVVRHILSFARKSVTTRKPVQISPVIKDSLKLLRASIPTTIEIRKDFSCEYDTVLADPTQINQVLMNLCTNAAHAVSEKGGVLAINLEDINLDE